MRPNTPPGGGRDSAENPERSSIPQGHLVMNEYYGVADEVEKNGRTTWTRLDCVAQADADKLTRARGVSVAEIETHVFELRAESRALLALPGMEGTLPRRDRWYRVTTGARGLEASRFPGTLQEGGAATRVRDLTPLDTRANPARALPRMFSLDAIPDADPAALAAALQRRGDGDLVMIYNVGQGSCSAIVDHMLDPIVFFDFGGAIGPNLATDPRTFMPGLSSRPPVILSHWDMDHWASATRVAGARDSMWIVPRQRIGPTHAKLAADLHSRKHLLIWPSGTSLRLPFGRLVGCTGSNRNNSGLALLYSPARRAARALLPGDAHYECIPKLARKALTHLVATHHGGRYRGPAPRASGRESLIAYSFGAPNTYGHPCGSSRLRHQAAGWRAVLETPNGSILMGRRLTKSEQVWAALLTLPQPIQQ